MVELIFVALASAKERGTPAKATFPNWRLEYIRSSVEQAFGLQQGLLVPAFLFKAGARTTRSTNRLKSFRGGFLSRARSRNGRKVRSEHLD